MTDKPTYKIERSANSSKKPWQTPVVKREKVAEITRITGGGSGDGASCHS